MEKRPIVLLDCTLRDGGYYNNWDFPTEVVQDYLHAISALGFSHAELGFRTLEREGFKGPTAFTKDSFLQSLEIPNGLAVGVMVNSSELSGSEIEFDAVLEQLFPSESSSNVSFVRLATHPGEIECAQKAARWLQAKGFVVAINLMQISEVSPDTLLSLVSNLDEKCVDVLYIADSLGSLTPSGVGEIVRSLRTRWSGDIGIHAHDNGGLALANTLEAIRAGARWVDGTVTGMGRGAGNTRSELLVGHLAEINHLQPDSTLLEELVNHYFNPLMTSKKWGTNVHYVLASNKSIHPSFVQALLSNSAYTSIEIQAAIDFLGRQDSQRFSSDSLEAAESWVHNSSNPKSLWDQRDLFRHKKILFLGSGVTVSLHRKALEIFADDDSIMVVQANLGGVFPDHLVDARVACHPLRVAADAESYLLSSALVLAPASFLPPKAADSLKANNQLRDVGVEIGAASAHAGIGFVSLPEPQVLSFGLALFLSGEASHVFMAGFDGYAEGDSRRQKEQASLTKILSWQGETSVTAITPTAFDVPKGSVYAFAP